MRKKLGPVSLHYCTLFYLEDVHVSVPCREQGEAPVRHLAAPVELGLVRGAGLLERDNAPAARGVLGQDPALVRPAAGQRVDEQEVRVEQLVRVLVVGLQGLEALVQALGRGAVVVVGDAPGV